MVRHRVKHAFTLLELIIVMLIIAVLAAAGIPQFVRSVNVHQVTCAAERIKVDLAFAQQRAKAQSAQQTVQFDPAQEQYTLPGVADLDHPTATYTVDLARHCSAEIVSADFGGDTEIVFDGFGVPDSNGTVIVQSGVFQRTVQIDPETGEASIL